MRVRLVAAALCTALLGGAGALHAGRGAPGQRMQDAGRALLDVAGDHLADLQTAADSRERLVWDYGLVPRRGLPLLAVRDDAVREAVWGLVDTGLGERGRRQARQVLTLAEIASARDDRDDMDDPGRYFLTVFGVPGRLGRWSWRFEGHHLSLSFALLDGTVVGTTPAFFGAGPARVDDGPHAGLRPFAAEEDDARALVRGLSAELQRRAVLSSDPPADILTGADVPAARPPLLGVSYRDLDAGDREAVVALLSLYASRLMPELAAAEMAAIEAAGMERVHFAWAGSLEPGQPCYYRIQGPTFVVEYDYVQEDTDHVHTVWRNFERDFGNAPLRAHPAAGHRTQEARHTLHR